MYVLVCIGLLSTPFAADFRSSGLAWRGRGRGAQLYGEFAFYAPSRRLRAWPGGGEAHSWMETLFSTPFAGSRRQLLAWPGGGVGGVRSWTGNPLSTPLAADFGRNRAWPGEGGGGPHSWTRSLLIMPLAANFGPGLDRAEGCAALACVLPSYLSLTGPSTGGQAMLGHWPQHHLRL